MWTQNPDFQPDEVTRLVKLGPDESTTRKHFKVKHVKKREGTKGESRVRAAEGGR